MRLIFKLSLFTMASAIASQMAFANGAIAGLVPTITPDSSTNGLGDSFAPTTPPSEESIEEIINDYLDDIGQNSSVPSGNDGEPGIPITDSQVTTIRDAISSENPTSLAQSLTNLQEQLSDELGGSTIVLSRVGNSRGDVVDAVTAANDLINSLDDQSLSVAAESPTLATLLRLLEDANASLNSEPDLTFTDDEGEFGLIRIAQGVVPVVEPVVEPEPIMETQRQAVESEVIEQPAPEPIRGLW